jgi:2-polyprenyl-6-hydroxyphenyl methylase/3-demethylubiquinone-9 3-methyltransferase
MDIGVYSYDNGDFNHSHDYLTPPLLALLEKYHKDKKVGIFDLGCGNGSIAFFLSKNGYQVSGVDPSKEGIRHAKSEFPFLNLELGHSGDNLLVRFGTFDFIYSLEVIEHVFDPYEFMKDVSSILNKGGYLILSTPFHGYLKNLILSIFNKWDKHFTALWRGGHIKFWSPSTLTQLLNESGFAVIEVKRVGRVPIIAKSMIVIAQKV